MSIRVLIADDHSVMRRGIRSLLLARSDLRVCAEAVDGQHAIKQALELRPDLIVMDLSMPVMGGFEAARILRGILPDIPIIFYSMHDSNQLLKEAKRLGVQGFVRKTEASDALLDAIEAVIDHKSTFFPESARDIEVQI